MKRGRDGIAFGRDEVGCWADGTFGDDHLREVLADMMNDLAADDTARDLLDEDPDVNNDAVLEALEVLEIYTAAGLEWRLEGGDLCLVEVDDEDR